MEETWILPNENENGELVRKTAAGLFKTYSFFKIHNNGNLMTMCCTIKRDCGCQMRNGIMMSQTEVIRPENLGISNQSFSFQIHIQKYQPGRFPPPGGDVPNAPLPQ